MPHEEPRSQRRKAYSHLKRLESDRRKPDSTAQLPRLSDRSVVDKAIEEARKIRRREKIEGYGTENREELTRGEQAMFRILRELAWRFNTEHPIGNYIADFYVHQFRMVIEVDGGYHTEYAQRQRDKRRDRWMVWKGYRVVRFTNDQVLNCPDAAKAEMMSRLEPTNPNGICTRVLPCETSQQQRLSALDRKLHARIFPV
jgi:very-short-patch-repair endonuclease